MDATLGFRANEVVSRIMDFCGNYSNKFQTYLENSISLAEVRYCKAHDWEFLRKTNLPLAVTNGTDEYDLTSVTIGYNMYASDVESIIDSTNGTVMRKITLKEMRRRDPQQDDGNADDHPVVWAEVGQQRIKFWPPVFKTDTLKIDGKIQPSIITDMNSYLTIPVRYQESFIEYMIAIGLDFLDDARASAKKAEALALIRNDIQDTMRGLGETSEPRIHALFEARLDGTGGSLNSLLFGWLSSDEY